MSKTMTTDALMRAFPSALSETEAIRMIASLTAEELADLRDATDLTRLYTRIDELDEALVDILADDFRIEWYDSNAEVQTKRNLLKSCFYVHNKLGTVGAVRAALASVYPDAVMTEKERLGGPPYRYGIELNTGSELLPDGAVSQLARWLEIYANVRSVLDHVTSQSELQLRLFACIPAYVGSIIEASVPAFDPSMLSVLTDELGEVLMTDREEILIE